MKIKIEFQNTDKDELVVNTDEREFIWFVGDAVAERGKTPHWNLEQSGGYQAMFSAIMTKVWDILERRAEKK